MRNLKTIRTYKQSSELTYKAYLNSAIKRTYCTKNKTTASYDSKGIVMSLNFLFVLLFLVSFLLICFFFSIFFSILSVK